MNETLICCICLFIFGLVVGKYVKSIVRIFVLILVFSIVNRAFWHWALRPTFKPTDIVLNYSMSADGTNWVTNAVVIHDYTTNLTSVPMALKFQSK